MKPVRATPAKTQMTPTMIASRLVRTDPPPAAATAAAARIATGRSGTTTVRGDAPQRGVEEHGRRGGVQSGKGRHTGQLGHGQGLRQHRRPQCQGGDDLEAERPATIVAGRGAAQTTREPELAECHRAAQLPASVGAPPGSRLNVRSHLLRSMGLASDHGTGPDEDFVFKIASGSKLV